MLKLIAICSIVIGIIWLAACLYDAARQRRHACEHRRYLRAKAVLARARNAAIAARDRD